MRRNKTIELGSYLISVLIHAIVFLFLSLLNISQSEKIKELSIDWITSEATNIMQEDFTPFGSTGDQSIQDIGSNGNVSGTNSGDNLPSDIRSQTQRVGRSIEPPTVNPNTGPNTSPTPGTGSSYLSGVKSKLGSGSTGSSGFQLDDDGGNIIVLKSVLPDPVISDYGLVKLQFSIKSDGTVNPESVVPVLLDDPIYTEASIKALKQWRFSVRGMINNKIYRISFIFKPE